MDLWWWPKAELSPLASNINTEHQPPERLQIDFWNAEPKFYWISSVYCKIWIKLSLRCHNKIIIGRVQASRPPSPYFTPLGPSNVYDLVWILKPPTKTCSSSLWLGGARFMWMVETISQHFMACDRWALIFDNNYHRGNTTDKPSF